MKISPLATILLFGPVVNARVRRIRKIQQQIRKLHQQLVGYGADPNPSRFPLQKCEGDCDNDFERDFPPPGGAWAEVPGCFGGSDFTAKTDFCIEAPVVGTPQSPRPTYAPTYLPTENPTFSPTDRVTAMPTERDVTMAPSTMEPTMTPTGEAYWSLPEMNYVGDNVATPAFPLGLCQGDCDGDTDCVDELVCLQRDLGEPVPWCRGIARVSVDYCVKPPSLPGEVVTMAPPTAATPVATGMMVVIQTVGDANEIPIGICQGDCDTDDDCLDDLICFQRDNVELVPGCIGIGTPSYDYCIVDPDRSSEGGEVVTLSPVAPPVISPSMAPSLDPILPVLSIVNGGKDANKGGNKGEEGGPLLGLCEGSCKNSDECEGDLVCMKRDRGEAVPGCDGEANKGDDYCIYPL